MAQETPETDIFPVEPPLGMYTVQVDDKGRLKLPMDFQTFFGSFADKKMYVTSLDGVTGQIYPISIWRQNLRKFSRSTDNQKAVRKVMFNANDLGSEAQMDSSGRITICPKMRDVLKLAGQEVQFQIVRGHVELLSDALYQQQVRESRPEPGEVVVEMPVREATENMLLLEGMGLL